MSKNLPISDDTMQANPLLKIMEVNAYRENRCVIHDFSFTLNKGEICAVTAQTHEELSDFFSLLHADLDLRKGSIEIDNQSGKRLFRKGAFVRRGNDLYPSLTVMQNIFYDNGLFFSIEKEGRLYDRFYETIQTFSIDIKPEILCSSLNRDEQTIVETLKAFLSNRQLIIMFNTLSTMGHANSFCVEMMMRKMKEQGRGILYLASKSEYAVSISDKIAIIRDGTICRNFKTEDVRRDPKEFVFFLTGADAIGKIKDLDENSDNDLLSAIVYQHEMINSNYTLTDNLKFFAEKLRKLMKADSCFIYGYDYRFKGITQTVSATEGREASGELKRDKVLNLIMTVDSILTMQKGKPEFKYMMLQENENVQTMVIAKAETGSPITALIQLVYLQTHELTKNEITCVKAFVEEVSVALELSLLMNNSLLLQETHHRIKNNLQMIISILSMYFTPELETEDPRFSEIIDSTITRIRSISLVHDILAHDEFSNGKIDLKTILDRILGLYESDSVHLKMEIEDLYIAYNKATLVGMIVNELISNSVKHADKIDGSNTNIKIFCGFRGKEYCIDEEDDGNGLPDNFDRSNLKSVGFSIVDSVVHTAEGSWVISNKSVEKGVRVKVSLSEKWIMN